MTLTIVAAMVAVSFGGYASALVFGDEADPLIAKALAVGLVAVITLVNLSGSSAAAKLSSLVVVTIAILAVFSVAGLTQADPALLAPETYPEFRKILASVALTFFAFLGFGVIAFSAEDIKDPGRNLPRAMYAAIVIATVIYIAIALAVFGTLTLDEVIAAGDNALAVAAYPIFGDLGFIVVSLVALLATTSALNSNLYAATGATAVLGGNRMLPPILARKVGGGSMGLVIAAVVTAVIAFFLDLSAIASLGSAVSLLVFIMASFAHLRVRHETGGSAVIIWAAAISASLTFLAFVVSTWVDAPNSIILILVFVIAAIVFDQVWSRMRDRQPTPAAPPGAA
jgi:amino acid transporter